MRHHAHQEERRILFVSEAWVPSQPTVVHYCDETLFRIASVYTFSTKTHPHIYPDPDKARMFVVIIELTDCTCRLTLATGGPINILSQSYSYQSPTRGTFLYSLAMSNRPCDGSSCANPTTICKKGRYSLLFDQIFCSSPQRQLL